MVERELFFSQNLSVDYKSNLHSILKEIKLVFGIQSTALLEASYFVYL